MLARLCAWLASWALARPRAVLAAAAVAALLSAAVASRLEIDTDVLAIAPRDLPEIEALVAVTERFGSFDRLVVSVEAEPGAEEAAREVAAAVAQRLATHPAIDRLESAPPPLPELLAALQPVVPALLHPAEAEKLAARLDPDALLAAARLTRARLAAPHPPLVDLLAAYDPFDFAAPLLDRLAGNLAIGGSGAADGVISSPDRRFAVVVARPRRPARDVAATRRLVEGLRAEAEDIAQRVASELPPPGEPAPRLVIGLAGAHALAAEDAGRIRRDLARTSIVAVLAVTAVFLLGLRGWVPFLATAAALVTGTLATYAVASLLLGRLSVATSAVAALVLGLGVDSAIVILSRVRERAELAAGGEDRMAATAAAVEEVGPGAVVGAATTAATFGGFLAASFPGLQELGLLVGTGILCSLGAVLVLVPAVIAVAGRAGAARAPGAARQSRCATPRRGARAWLPAVVGLGLRRPWPVVASWGLVVGLGLWILPTVGFDDSLGALRAADSPAARLQTELAESFGIDLAAMSIELEAANDTELLSALAKAHRLLEPLIGDEIVGVVSLGSLLPPIAEQRASLARITAAGVDRTELVESGRRALEQAGFAPAAFEATLQRWGAALGADPGGLALPSTLLAGPAAPLARTLVRYQDGRVHGLVQVAMPPGRWRSAPPPRLTALAEREGWRLAGLNAASAAMRRSVRRDLVVCGSVALVATLALLLLDARSLAGALIAFAPVVPALAVVAILAGPGGLRVSFLSLFAVVMLVGIGVDYGIHMVHRARLGLDPESLGATARAILLAAGTTAGGFGALALSSFVGLRAVGVDALVGALVAALAALTLVPALLRLALRGRATIRPFVAPSAAGGDEHEP